MKIVEDLQAAGFPLLRFCRLQVAPWYKYRACSDSVSRVLAVLELTLLQASPLTMARPLVDPPQITDQIVKLNLTSGYTCLHHRGGQHLRRQEVEGELGGAGGEG